MRFGFLVKERFGEGRAMRGGDGIKEAWRFWGRVKGKGLGGYLWRVDQGLLGDD
jgi:hypothetical protein